MRDLIKLSSFTRPSDEKIACFQSSQQEQCPTYSDAQRAKRTEIQSVETIVGRGSEDFSIATGLIQKWVVFHTPDGVPYPPAAPPEVGQTTVNLLREFGIYFLLACRITEVIDEPNRYGFTFETLPGHVATGWESFMVSMDENTNEVRYSIHSKSTHRFMLTRIAAPLMHWLQRNYKKNSARTIKAELTRSRSN